MSHVQIFYVESPSESNIKNLIGHIGKGNDAKVRGVVIKKMIDYTNSPANILDSISHRISNKKLHYLNRDIAPDPMGDHKVKLDKQFLASLNTFLESTKTIISNKHDAPHEIVGSVIHEFTKFNQAHNLGYIAIKDLMTDLLTSITIDRVCADPKQMESTIAQSLDVFQKSANKTSKEGTPYNLHSYHYTTNTFALNKLKAISDFIHHDMPKVNVGITETMPNEFFDHMKSSFKELFYGKNISVAAFSLFDAAATFRFTPASVAFKTKHKHLPKPIPLNEAIEKLKTIFKEKPYKEYRHEAMAMEAHIMEGLSKTQVSLNSSLNFRSLTNILIKVPESLSLVKNGATDFRELNELHQAIYVYKRFEDEGDEKANAHEFATVSKSLAERFITKAKNRYGYINYSQELAEDTLQFKVKDTYFKVDESGFFVQTDKPELKSVKERKLRI